jgi:hypothetical protein
LSKLCGIMYSMLLNILTWWMGHVFYEFCFMNYYWWKWNLIDFKHQDIGLKFPFIKSIPYKYL